MVKNKVRYTLFSQSQGTKLLETDPLGWDDDTRKISRSIDKPGIVFDYAKDLSFYGDGYEFIKSTETVEGFDAVITCTKEYRNNEDRWEVEYKGEIDLSSKKSNFNSYTVKMKKGGLALDLKAAFNDSFELERLDSIDGKVIPALTYRNGFLNGRNLDVTSLLENKETVSAVQGVISGGTSHYIPQLTKVFSGDSNISGVFNALGGFSAIGATPILSGDKAYVSRSSTDKKLNLKIKAVADYSFEITGQNGVFAALDVGFAISKFIDANNPNVYQRFEVIQGFEHLNLPVGLSEFSLNINTDFVLELAKDEIAYFDFRFFTGDALQTNNHRITHTEIVLESQQDSIAPPTAYEGLTVLDAAKRLSLITFGRDLVISDELTNGEFKDLLITSGKKLRGFPDSIELSWKTLIESAQKVINLDYGIEITAGVEKIVFRKFDDFFKRRSVIDLGFVGDVGESPTSLNEKVTVGYKEAGEYEERQGLDEHNTISNFKHKFKSIDGELDLVSDIRADNLAIELARRKPRSEFPTEDTPYDKDNFFIDCYVQSGVYVNRNWEKDFAVLPSGIYSPQTAFNLRLSPKNVLYRYSNRITSLAQYRDRSTLFINAVGSSKLKTQLFNQPERLERSDIPNSALLKPLFQPYEVEIVSRFTDEQLKLIMRSTNGLPNYYLSIAYTDRNGPKQYGYFLEYQPSKEGSIKLIKANYGI